jgi:hypothetical protein
VDFVLVVFNATWLLCRALFEDDYLVQTFAEPKLGQSKHTTPAWARGALRGYLIGLGIYARNSRMGNGKSRPRRPSRRTLQQNRDLAITSSLDRLDAAFRLEPADPSHVRVAAALARASMGLSAAWCGPER